MDEHLNSAEAAALPLVFATAQKQALEHGLKDYLTWLNQERRRCDGRIAWDTDEASRQRRYIGWVQTAVAWQRDNAAMNQGTAQFMASLGAAFNRGGR